MLEVKTEENTENEAPIESTETIEETTTVAAAAASPEPPPPLSQNEQNNEVQNNEVQNNEVQNNEVTLNPLNDQENNADVESKTKHRRYWTPKEEEKFYEIWGRENWRLTRHGKNTIFFAKWADEMKERFNIDVKPEEVQCKVNQTRAKFRQVKKHLESDKNAAKWKKYDIVEKILKNQYRSKDDEPVPLEALENNRDVSPTELLNSATQPSSPSSISNMSNIPEGNINLSQSLNVDHQLTDEVNMSSASLSDQNLFCNNSQSANSFSTELFGSDQLEIKQEIENDLKREGFTEFSLTDATSEQRMDGIVNESINNNNTTDNQTLDNQSQLMQPTLPPQLPSASAAATENSTSMEPLQIHSSNPNSLLIQNRVAVNHNSSNSATVDGVANLTNHANINHNTVMQPPKALTVAASPRKRNRSSSNSANVTPVTSENLESLYLEEVRKRNVLLVEQGAINNKRLRLEERKVKLMEEFFPKFMNLQQEILQKLENVTKSPTDITN